MGVYVYNAAEVKENNIVQKYCTKRTPSLELQLKNSHMIKFLPFASQPKAQDNQDVGTSYAPVFMPGFAMCSSLQALGIASKIITEGYCARIFSSSSSLLWCPDLRNAVLVAVPQSLQQQCVPCPHQWKGKMGLGFANGMADKILVGLTSAVFKVLSPSLYVSWFIEICERLLQKQEASFKNVHHTNLQQGMRGD